MPSSSARKSSTGHHSPRKNSTTSSARVWKGLLPGDQIRVQSMSGNAYEATVVLAGRDGSGLFIRLGDGKLARLAPSRVNWKTLEKVGVGDPIAVGDEVLVVALGTERRGTIAGPIDERISLSLSRGKTYSIPMEETETKKFRLVFPTKTVKPGDEFMVKSLSGTEYRGIINEVTESCFHASLRPSRQRVKLLISRLDMDSLNVLLPVLGLSATWDPEA